ncbi:hypothetical protein Scep_030282 [Stephania cephalantha]|uniref:Uncharacterized protein n=1 Tax=Stephania cephalantha TaxID=152367 RepID=A0AAP0DZH3_9MAGN
MLHDQIYNLETLLLQAPNRSIRGAYNNNPSHVLCQKLKPTQKSNPLRRCYEKLKYSRTLSIRLVSLQSLQSRQDLLRFILQFTPVISIP